ncbi:hypothetical protein BZA05DRAFT_145714 [Tricharina praecox]|uniref:uncharacterized protein n=1 Tax=Tricharina praecox TaxID=43433 RepID=UPI00221EAFBA|nr:uncharacterized protein BZA05DRAFT_145714 [Tricharina praecox]KAI5845480.1 hypothetical protein BZA05DRAFT_145714 [Tricharina praecox]
MASVADYNKDTPPTLMTSLPTDAASASALVDDGAAAKLTEILRSEIGVAALLTRLKQSISSSRDFAVFLKKRAMLEDDQAQGIRKLCKATIESLRRPDCRQESYGHQFEGITRLHDRLAENGLDFALALHQIHDEMLELANNMERNRKHWKQTGTTAEKKAHDAEQAAEKAKAKYISCAEEYDRVKTGARPTKSFGFKASRSGSQHEEELHRRVLAASADYESKVQIANANRQELVAALRPQAVGALRELVRECDAGLTVHLQKYAELNEKLILRNALTINPPGEPEQTRTLRDMVGFIDNDNDFKFFLFEFSSKTPLPLKEPELKFEPHPSLVATQPFHQQQQQQHPQYLQQQHQQQQHQQQQHQQQQHQQQQHQEQQHQQQQHMPQQQQYQQQQHQQQQHFQQQQLPQQLPQQPLQQPQPHQQYGIPQNTPPQGVLGGIQGGIQGGIRNLLGNGNGNRGSPVQLNSPAGMAPQDPQSAMVPNGGGFGAVIQQPVTLPIAQPVHPGQVPMLRSDSQQTAVHPTSLNPIFGVSLDDLFARDDLLIPKVIEECIQAVELYGLDVEGIYRLSGDKKHVDQIKIMFDNDQNLDFRRPEDFFHDVNSVASVLKQFLMELPDPVITNELYAQFIGASKIDDPVSRRDALHGLINQLPDPNYAILRRLILHLHAVQQHANTNRMNTGNLAICFGPTLMCNTNANMADTGWQVRAIDTVLQNCFSIFDNE